MAAPPPASAADLIRRAGEAYEQALQAQRQGDWARYGEEIRRLGGVLEELNRNRNAQPAPKQ